MRRFLGQLRTLIWKDLLVEARGRETVLAGAVFALLVLVIFWLLLICVPILLISTAQAMAPR